MASKQILALLIAVCAGFCSAECPTFYRDVDGYCLLMLNGESNSWNDAISTCEAYGGTLAKVDDCDLLTAISREIFLNNLDTPFGYWIGANDLTQEGDFKWTSDDSDVYLGPPFWGGSAGQIEPNGAYIQNCVSLAASDRYFFHDTECDREMGVLCQTDPIGVPGNNTLAQEPVEEEDELRVVCPNSWIPIDDRCFQFYPDNRESWAGAGVACRRNGGQLAVVDNCRILRDLAFHIYNNDLSPTNPGLGLWIGADDVVDEGIFRWIDGSRTPIGMPFWGRSGLAVEPNGDIQENCLSMSDTDRYLFHDAICSDRKGYICETEQI